MSTDTATQADWITTREAARMLGLKSLSTVREWFDKGLITGYQIEATGTIRIDRSSVAAVIANGTPSGRRIRRPGTEV